LYFFLQAVLVKSTGEHVSASMQFVKYGAKHGKERSGAYLFLPDGAAKVDLDTVESHLYCHLNCKANL